METKRMIEVQIDKAFYIIQPCKRQSGWGLGDLWETTWETLSCS